MSDLESAWVLPGTSFRVAHYPGHVRFGSGERNGHMVNGTPEQARAVAAMLESHAAAEAEAEVDPADEDALAAILRGAVDVHDLARAMILAGWWRSR